MKTHFNIFMLAVVALLGLSLTACDNEDLNTDQYGNDISLNSFGPCPVLRGGTLYFYGSNLDQITQVDLPGADPITSIEVLESGRHSKISITVPAEKCDTGRVTLTTAKGGKITTLTPVTYREDIKIDEFYVGQSGTLAGNVGDLVTIKGDYLNLMHAVIFTEKDTVKEEQFAYHDRYTIQVPIPEAARTGELTLTDLAEEPSELTTEEALTVNLPTVASLTPETVKAGQTVTVKGTALTQIESIELQGATVSEMASQSASVLTFKLPDTATDGEVTLVTKSGVRIEAGSITTVVPTDLKTSPSPVKNGATVTITGKDLDLVTAISFPNAGDGEIASSSTTKLTATVPETAQEGDITLTLANGKTVTVAYTLVVPTVSVVSPTSVMAGAKIAIGGKDLDLVASITFPTDQTVEAADFEKQVSNGISVVVPSGASGSGFRLNLKNGTSVDVKLLTIAPSTNPTLTNSPSGNAGAEVTLEGKNYDNVESVYIGSTKVTKIVSRTSTQMTIVIPSTLDDGTFDVVMNTLDGGTFTVGKLTVVPRELTLSQGNCVLQGDQSSVQSFPMTLTWDDSGRFRIQRNAPIDLTKYAWKAGVSKIKFYKVASTTGQIQFNDGSWGDFGAGLSDWSGGEEVLECVLTQSMIDWITGASNDGWSQTAFIVQGDGLTLTKITAIP